MHLDPKWKYLSHDKRGEFVLWAYLPQWDATRGSWVSDEGRGRGIASDIFAGMPERPLRKYKLLWKIQRDTDDHIFFEEIT